MSKWITPQSSCQRWVFGTQLSHANLNSRTTTDGVTTAVPLGCCLGLMGIIINSGRNTVDQIVTLTKRRRMQSTTSIGKWIKHTGGMNDVCSPSSYLFSQKILIPGPEFGKCLGHDNGGLSGWWLQELETVLPP